MILIADSGSTKTTWCFADRQNDKNQFILTSGINPYYQNESEILDKLKSEFSLELPDIGAIYFYGAGCTNPEVNRVVAKPLKTFFGAEQIEVNTDLMAAARSLCGRDPGIACILGTGSNSCYYDGKNIVNHVSPLGFILGDEGSGAVLGKTLLSDILKKQLPESMISLFYEEYKVTPVEIMENIYRRPFPNRYAAQFSRFLYKHSEKPEIRNLLTKSFRSFFTRNVLQYPEAFHYPVHFSGSIAWYFQDLLKETAVSLSLKPGKIVQDPIEGLVEYHLRSI
jgi:N-acetylglucosamine kinase-like BadF-type ATPase